MRSSTQPFYRPLGRFATVALFSLMVGALVLALAPGAVAQGKPGPKPGSGTASCSVSPNPVPLGTDYAISGSGYVPGEVLEVVVINAQSTTLLFSGADANGNFTLTWHTFQIGADTVTVKDYASGRILTGCGFSIT